MLNIFISQQNVMVRASTNPHHNSLTTITEEEPIKVPSWNASGRQKPQTFSVCWKVNGMDF